MKANELMIGDWVSSDDGNAIIIPPIAEDGVFLKDEAGICAASFDRINAIPLTAEILEKNGFEVRDRYIWEQRDNYCCVKLNIAPKIEIEGEIFDESPILLQVDGATFSLNIIVEYVHELQHALRICGIEKEVVL